MTLCQLATITRRMLLILFQRKSPASLYPELVAEALRLAYAFELERHGVNRLLKVLDALLCQLRPR